MHIIIINGYGTSGKDTFVKLFREHCFGDTYNYSTISTIEMIAKKLGWNNIKDEKGRKLLSDLKDAWMEYNDGPFKETVSLVNSIKNHKKKFVKNNKNIFLFIHCREIDEIKKFKNHFGNECKTLLIRNPRIQVPNIESEFNLENYNYDYIIDNDSSLVDLSKKAYNFKEILCSNTTQN